MANNLITKDLSSLIQVSRETIESLNEFKRILLENNKKFNLISSKDEEIIDVRHIQDSAQIIDLIDKKSKKCIDLGSGAGFPGIVISIIMKHNNISTVFDLYEKSPKKSDFLGLVSEKLELNTQILNKNVFEEKNLEANSITARAFKPIDKIFKIMTTNFKNYQNLILFLGKNGKQNFLEASKVWDFEYKERMSVTSSDSLIVSIKNIKKKN